MFRIRIAEEGMPYLLSGGALALCGVPLASAGAGKAAAVVACVGAAFAGACAYFFRDPDRPLPADETKVFSPADGRVLSLERGDPSGDWTLRIFLSILDIHVQRVPCSGEVRRVEYREGSFRAAMLPEASGNERNLVAFLVEGRGREVEVEQIAGFIARRIRCWIQKGECVVAGGRYGLIQCGSQVAVRLPSEVRPCVKAGDRVIGGVTAVGEWARRPGDGA